jgi:hypothetical protein
VPRRGGFRQSRPFRFGVLATAPGVGVQYHRFFARTRIERIKLYGDISAPRNASTRAGGPLLRKQLWAALPTLAKKLSTTPVIRVRLPIAATISCGACWSQATALTWNRLVLFVVYMQQYEVEKEGERRSPRGEHRGRPCVWAGSFGGQRLGPNVREGVNVDSAQNKSMRLACCLAQHVERLSWRGDPTPHFLENKTNNSAAPPVGRGTPSRFSGGSNGNFSPENRAKARVREWGSSCRAM